MYHAVIPCLPENISSVSKDGDGNKVQTIFAPFITAYEIHSINITVVASIFTEENFNISPPFIEWKCKPSISKICAVVMDVKYFYKSSIFKPEMEALSNAIIDSTSSGYGLGRDMDIFSKRRELFSKHFVDGLFAFDNGLYKEAVVNFGTVAEVLLNVNLENKTLNRLILNASNDHNADAIRIELDNIRNSRNKVHANKLRDLKDISRREATLRRHDLDKVISYLTNLSRFPRRENDFGPRHDIST